MAYLEIRGQRHTIGVGETAIGYDTANKVAFGGEELRSKSAILHGMPDGQVVVRRADAHAEVLINGIRLGPQPTPLLHGDKIEIGGHELLFADDRRSGSTEYIKAVDPMTLGASAKAKSKGSATAGTGGRLVSLTDGREYEISGGSILIGRDAGCDIVISSKNVSRRHAEVVATPRGYVLIDNSTNGTLVNNERVQGQHVLSRADVFRCGDHEFRFYADAAEVSAAPPTTPAPEPSQPAPSPPPSPPPAAVAPPTTPAPEPSQPAPSPPPSPPPTAARGAEQRLAHTMHGIPAMPRPGTEPVRPPPQTLGSATESDRTTAPPPDASPAAARGAEQRLAHTMHGIPAMPKDKTPPPARHSRAPKSLASLLVRSGTLKGQRLHVKVPIVNIGRAEYNDIVLPDDSVSTVHAKLQRREGIWVLVDLESTNGTIVDGEPVEGEAPLAPGAIVRFGTIQTIFEPTDDAVQAQQGGGTQVLHSVKITPPDESSQRGSRGSGPAPGGGHASMSAGSNQRLGANRVNRTRCRTRRAAPARAMSHTRNFRPAGLRLAIVLFLTSNGIR